MNIMFKKTIFIFFLLCSVVYAQQIRISGINSPVKVNLRSGTGTPISSTTLGDNELLDVNVDTGTIVATIIGPLTVIIKDGGDSHTVDIGTAATGAADLAKAEDAVHGDGDVGIMSLAVRNDTLATLAGTDGDYTPLQVSGVGSLYISGGAADGSAAVGNPVQIAGHDFGGTTMAIPTMFTASSITMGFMNLSDSSGNLNSIFNSGIFVTGDEAHDAVDAGNPIKIGGKATDTDPSQNEGSIAPLAVAENDRVDAWFNDSGAVVEAVHAQYELLGEITGEYTSGTATKDSGIMNTWFFRQATLGFDLSVTGTPTDITFEVFCNNDGSGTFREQKLMNGALGAWIYDDTAVGVSGIKRVYTFPIACYQMKARATCVGCGDSGVTSFTIDNATMFFRN